ncbi:uncharacterized protein N0V89_006066 [Didymosphaeria variabile]|uniref:Uncharacterized protein n=1 Tax=Didymosphaeria variabile TaxID=1932322 RepID=A0A9W8XM68_9PLEO|nr:uncharacterized protein N0V89_006066 [Didymosphaeria variabile]KAJ4354331.1 hypothetical protein N0V89_006066 [Didymosphaeria variabile]
MDGQANGPPARMDVRHGPGGRGRPVKYSYYDGVLYANGFKRESADEIRNRLKSYKEKGGLVTVNYMCDIPSPFAIEFEDDVRREYYGLEPSRSAEQWPLYLCIDKDCYTQDPYNKYVVGKGAPERFKALITPEAEARFLRYHSKKRSRSEQGDSPATEHSDQFSKRQRFDEPPPSEAARSPAPWIDENDPVFRKDTPTPPAALIKKLAIMDQKTSRARPRVFAHEGPGTAARSYSFHNGKIYLGIHTREPASFIKDRLHSGELVTKDYMVAQLHLWGCTVVGKGERSKDEITSELWHSLESGWVSMKSPNEYVCINEDV